MRIHHKHSLRRLGALVLALAMTFALASCGGSDKPFDASGYVEASLNLITTGEDSGLSSYSKEAAVFTKEDYEAEIKETIESVAGEMELSEETQTAVENMVQSMLSSASFTVGEATENEDGSFDVPLTVKPLQLNIADDVTKWMAGLDYTQSFDMDDLYSEIFQIMQKAVDKKEYGTEQTYTVHVAKNDNGLYDADEDEMSQVGQNLFTTDLTDLMS